MRTLQAIRSSLKVIFLAIGTACSLTAPVFSQPIPVPLPPGPSGGVASVTPALQPPKIIQPPIIKPPPIPERPLAIQAKSLLSTEFAALFPQFDGDGFFFVSKKAEATLGLAESVFGNAMLPFLNAIGFQNPGDRFRKLGASYGGRELPKADLNGLVDAGCREWWIQQDEKATQTCNTLKKSLNSAGDTMGFLESGVGMTVSKFRGEFENGGVEFFFVQHREVKPTEHPDIPKVPKMVPLEHTGIRVEGRKGQVGLFITGRTINDDDKVINKIAIRPGEVMNYAREALLLFDGIRSVSGKPLAPIELLLLPYGGTQEPQPRPAFKYAYRTALQADFLGVKGIFYMWVDAESGAILELVPTMGSARATGKTFMRNPGSLPNTALAEFDIDDLSGGVFVLGRAGIFERLDGVDDGYDDGELAKKPSDFIPPLTNSELDRPRLDRDPMGNIGIGPAAAQIKNVSCASGSNKDFAQIDLMATVNRYRGVFNAAGPLSLFPRSPRTIHFNHEGTKCDAGHGSDGFSFGVCDGYKDFVNCPDLNDLNPAHDHTVVAHEFGHEFTSYQYRYPSDPTVYAPQTGDRPTNWCLGSTLEDGQRPAGTTADPCPMPTNVGDIFHDFADAWSHHLENTNCFGGWVAKNRGGTDTSKDCLAGHSELNDWPRLADAVQDHFPEHRTAAAAVLVPSAYDPYPQWKMPYSDMQIAAAALWSVRQGLKSRDPVWGEFHYLRQFVRTLGTTGWLGALTLVPASPAYPDVRIYSDRDIYRHLVELEVKLVSRWAGALIPEESTLNKAVSGFARGGIFMIPAGCLDGDATTPIGSPCESGADAVVDVEPGKDYLTRTAGPPVFHIWTGPLYKFQADGLHSLATSSCNTAFEVEISTDKTFVNPANKKISTPVSGVWLTATGCHATWQPDLSDWNALVGTSGRALVYYHVTTSTSAGGELRDSNRPANGLFGDVDPPYLVVSDDVTPPAAPTNLRLQ